MKIVNNEKITNLLTITKNKTEINDILNDAKAKNVFTMELKLNTKRESHRL